MCACVGVHMFSYDSVCTCVHIGRLEDDAATLTPLLFQLFHPDRGSQLNPELTDVASLANKPPLAILSLPSKAGITGETPCPPDIYVSVSGSELWSSH